MKLSLSSSGLTFSIYKPHKQTPFEFLFEIFKELIIHTSGDFDEAIEWLRKLDEEYILTGEKYTIDDFVNDLIKDSYVHKVDSGDGKNGNLKITPKTEKFLREHALKLVFGKLKKNGHGNHKTRKLGQGFENTGELKSYQFGDPLEKISITESLVKAQIRSFNQSFKLQNEDLLIEETIYNTQMSTVLMIDISHSMILYGEDRITPAKKVAMALSEFITTRHSSDSLDVIVFGNDAWPVKIKDIPYLKVGPYHTNTVAGLNLAMNLLRKKRNSNKQIFMITDGKPSCIKNPDGTYYKNSMGLDKTIVDKCYNMAHYAKKLKIPITTFMIAQDPYLKTFVNNFTEANDGKAFYTGLKNLGEIIFKDYDSNKRKSL